jgi:hypothetical protein
MVAVGALVGVNAYCSVAKGVMGAGVKDSSVVPTMVAAACMGLCGGIDILLPHPSRTLIG